MDEEGEGRAEGGGDGEGGGGELITDHACLN